MVDNFQLNLFSLSGLINFVACLVLALFLIISSKTKVAKFYSFSGFSVSLWGIGGFLIGQAKSFEEALLYWKIAYSGVIFIPIFMLSSVFALTENHKKNIIFFAYLQGAIILLVNILNINNFWDLRFKFNSFFYPQLTPFFLISSCIWLFLAAYIDYELIKFYFKIRKKDKKKSNAILFFIISVSIGYTAGVSNFLPVFNINFYPFGNFLVPLFNITMAYAILKYQLFDINIVIRRGLVYSILITIFTIIYLCIVILVERLFQGILGYRSLLISIIFASIIALIFIPLKNKIQSFIDKIFLGKTPEQIAEENELLRQELLRSEKLKTIATFASGMAHEIKNPLTAIRTFTEYLPQRKDDNEFLEKFSKIVGSEVEKIDDLVHQLLDYSKPSPLQLRKVDVHMLLDETMELLNSEFIKHNIKIKKDYALDAIRATLRLDPKRMKQVFLNILLNAIEAMNSGGTLTVTTLLDAKLANKKNIEIRIENTGCRITEEDIHHIFEPFYTTKEKGTGLGLSLVYNIIKEQKGQIYVESGVNGGSIFIIKLPINFER